MASIPGRITITTMGRFPPQNSAQVTVTSGNTVVWRCEPPQSNPPAIIDYYKDNSYISPKLVVPKTMSLIIPTVGISDTGSYKCAANNIIQQSKQNAEFRLELRVTNKAAPQAPMFVIPPLRSYVVTAGELYYIIQ